MSKRTRASDADAEPKGGLPRTSVFAAYVKALNQQFAGWVAEQAAEHGGELWSDGVEDYLNHARKLVADFQDVLEGGASQNEAAGAAESPPAKRPAVSTPVTVPGSPMAGLVGPAGGGSSGGFGLPRGSTGVDKPPGLPSFLAAPGPVTTGTRSSNLGLLPPSSTAGGATGSAWGGPPPQPATATPSSTSGFGGGSFNFGGPAAGAASKPADATSAPASAATPTPSLFGGLFPPSSSSAAPASSPFPSFGLTAPSAGSKPANGAAASGFSFGISPAPLPPLGASGGTAAASAAPFSFSSPLAPSSAFTWTAAPSLKSGEPADKPEAEDGEGEEPAEYTPEIKVGADDEQMLFKHRGQLYVQADRDGKKTWVDRGMGLLTLRQPKGGSGGGPARPHLVFTMESGRLMVNAGLHRGLKAHQQGKANNIVMMPLVNAVAQEEGEPGGEAAALRPYLFKLDKAELAADLVKAIEEHTPQ